MKSTVRNSITPLNKVSKPIFPKFTLGQQLFLAKDLSHQGNENPTNGLAANIR